MLYSPINYQGNKSRIVHELLKYLPNSTTSIHEIFCGSGILSFVSNIEQIYLNDVNHHIIDLVQYFYYNKAADIIKQADAIINQFGLTNTFITGREQYIEFKHEGLSNYNRENYNRLKESYNKDKDIAKLFVLVLYGFNHYLRFNKHGDFNVPVGKTDFVASLRKRTIEYGRAVRSKQIVFSNFDFRDCQLYKNLKKTSLLYFDPPYLITKAPYNVLWSNKDEIDLLNLLDGLNEQGYKFLLSNVLESNGKENLLLKQWAKKYTTIHIKRQYLNSSYQKKNLSDAKEVIVLNY